MAWVIQQKSTYLICRELITHTRVLTAIASILLSYEILHYVENISIIINLINNLYGYMLQITIKKIKNF